PKRIHIRRIWIEHLGDSLEVVHAPPRVPRYIEERIPPRRATVLGEGIEQEAPLSAFLAKAGRRYPILTFDVDTDDGIRPVEKIRDDNTRPLACSGRCCERHALLAWQHEAPAPKPPENDSMLA